MPTLKFDGSDDVMVINGSNTAFDAWDEMSVFIVFQGVNIGNQRIIMAKNVYGGWFFGRWRSEGQALGYFTGTSAADDQRSAHNEIGTILKSLLYNMEKVLECGFSTA